jgi:hypothetical protein
MSTVTRLVDNTPFREAALHQIESGVSWSQIARAAGMVRSGPREFADTKRLKLRLGLVSERGRFMRGVRYETAVKLADALGLDYVDVGV